MIVRAIQGTIPSTFLVADTHLLLHHGDTVESLYNTPADNKRGNMYGERYIYYTVVDAIIVPQTALEEFSHQSLVMYQWATNLAHISSTYGVGARKLSHHLSRMMATATG